MITKLEAENFKRIKAIAIEPDGSPLVVVGGKNGQGKTSLLDSIEAALGGAKRSPAEPIRKGSKKSRVVVETTDLVVTRHFTAKGSRLEVKAKGDDSPLASPQRLLDSLVGSLSFDPLEFGRMDPAKRSRVLRSLVGLDLESLDRQRKEYETERRDVGRDKRRAEGALEKMPAPTDEDPGLSVSEILDEINAREKRNDDRNSKRSLLMTMRADAQTIVGRMKTRAEEIDRLEREVANLRELDAEEAEQLEGMRAKGKALAAEVETLPPDEPVDDLRAQLEKAEAVAETAAAMGRRAELEGETAGLRRKYDELTAKIEQLDAARDDAIASATYPIPGLEARDDGVYLQGVPWEQSSSAEQLRASVAIGLALNPKLKILLIRDGSLLDPDSLALVRDLAAEADSQLWIERVSTGSEVSVVIEDGEVSV